ncbi:hypothetical protein [Aliikangiella sp. IMCC44359]|uniref:hypothetical protein n=1 Tax=Aliikangiella sp. IMCC44359 TaxID=3459125 RepID=UPI00403ACF70
MEILTLLDAIKKRPSMYLGAASVVRLKSFLDGYYFSLENSEKEDEFWENFQKWISRKFNINTSQNWMQIILFFSNDELEGFKLFFKLLDEFKLHEVWR